MSRAVEAGEHPLEHAEGVLLLERQPPATLLGEDGGEQLGGLAAEFAPRGGPADVVEPALERGDEGEELLAGLGAALGAGAAGLVLGRLRLALEPLDVRLELGLPVGAADDPGLAGGALEPGDADPLAR